jgi:hypothetical protein
LLLPQNFVHQQESVKKLREPVTRRQKVPIWRKPPTDPYTPWKPTTHDLQKNMWTGNTTTKGTNLEKKPKPAKRALPPWKPTTHDLRKSRELVTWQQRGYQYGKNCSTGNTTAKGTNPEKKHQKPPHPPWKLTTHDRKKSSKKWAWKWFQTLVF